MRGTTSSGGYRSYGFGLCGMFSYATSKESTWAPPFLVTWVRCGTTQGPTLIYIGDATELPPLPIWSSYACVKASCGRNQGSSPLARVKASQGRS
ncbi:hypothetical protein B296_00026362 [Ensete ventricosum]|uniref:Uncharacterized protein n=1 Tax=Ensete ventricosum TaxID=4639 RepID=A0A426ZUC4_ENSVE|nr:hypothetical protein B296_00026362 [Ensete ventricosum]